MISHYVATSYSKLTYIRFKDAGLVRKENN